MLQQYPEWNPAYVTSAFHPAVEYDKTELLFFWPQMLRSRWHCDLGLYAVPYTAYGRTMTALVRRRGYRKP